MQYLLTSRNCNNQQRRAFLQSALSLVDILQQRSFSANRIRSTWILLFPARIDTRVNWCRLQKHLESVRRISVNSSIDNNFLILFLYVHWKELLFSEEKTASRWNESFFSSESSIRLQANLTSANRHSNHVVFQETKWCPVFWDPFLLNKKKTTFHDLSQLLLLTSFALIKIPSS